MIENVNVNTDVANKTNEIITVVNDHDNKLMQLLNWMGLVKDYVVETGSNANGNYEKWNSGKLVQWGKTSLEISYSSTYGSALFFYMNGRVTYPIEFIENPDYSKTTVGRIGVILECGYGNDGTTKTGPTNRFAYFSNSLTGTQDVVWKAIGKWK